MPCNMGSGEVTVQHLQEQTGHQIWLHGEWKRPFLPLQLWQPYTYFLTGQKTAFPPNARGYVSCQPQGHQQEHLLIGFMLFAKGKMAFLHCITPNRLLK